MRRMIVGTAGHVDHGKTALIKALNGYEGDETKEEQSRGITIDLSFSNLSNEDVNIAFIDVPGHEKLVKNMIAGAFGFDAVMLVVSASEGVMPQTKEHLEILNLLNVGKILVVLSKKDLVDEAMLQSRKEEIQELFTDFSHVHLEDVVACSINDEQSIQTLKEKLFSLQVAPKESQGVFRYYIDRVFSVKGAGTVTTGTILDSGVSLKEKVFVCELGKEVSIKGIQVHAEAIESAGSATRCALNLQGIEHKKLKKGFLLSKKGYLRGFNTIDVWLEAVNNTELIHDAKVKFYIGSKALDAKVLLYNAQSFKAGFAKVVFEESVFSVFDEPFIISANGQSIGGGRILNPIADPMKKRDKVTLLKLLHKKAFKEAFALLLRSHKKGFGLISSNQRFGLSHEGVIEIAKELEGAFVDEKELVVYSLEAKEFIKERVLSIYEKNRFALLSKTSIALRIKWASATFVEFALSELVSDGRLVLENNLYKDKQNQNKNLDEYLQEKILEILEAEGFGPRAPYNIYDDLDIDNKLGDNALKKLCSANKAKRLQHNLFLSSNSLAKLVATIRELISKHGFVDIKIMKERFGLSRKYLIAYLDYMDAFEDIKKEGIKRMFTHS